MVGVVGSLSRDVVGGGAPRPGGAPYYTARALGALGWPAVIAAKCTQEDRRLLVPPLVALGVPVSWRPAASTAAFTIDEREQGRAMTIEELGEPWTADQVEGWLDGVLADVEWVHLGALVRSDFPPETLATLAEGGRRLSFDGQGLARPAQTGPLNLDADFDRAVLEHVTVLKLAEEEALALTGSLEPSALAALGVPEVVVTLGLRGSIVIADGGSEEIPAQPLDVADTTGAGDAFAAGYLVARSAGDPPTAAARRATAVVADVLAGRR